jgi:Na+/H+ antiporter NhaC
MSSPSPHPYRFYSVFILWLTTWLFVPTDWQVKALWPSILALISVLLLQKVIAGLLVGASAGALLLAGGNPATAFMEFFTEHLIPSLQSGWNISVLIFTLLLGGFVALIEKGGGIQALVQRWMQSSRALEQRVQWSAYGFGLVCFFDGLANSLLVGKSLTPIAKHAGVSREKLSYIVDSTSAAVACVAVISTWIAYQLSMIKQGYELTGIEDVNTFGVFFRSLPSNFYCWFTLVLLALVIARNWNIGPMGKAEAAASRETHSKIIETNAIASPTGAWRAILPLAFLIGGLIIGLYLDGVDGDVFPISFTKVAQAFGGADAAKLLVSISALACIIAYLSNRSVLKDEDTSEVFLGGVLHLFTPCLILISVWILSSTIKELGAAEVLSHLLEGNLPPSLFPAVVFLVGTLISFTTGSSWGTMGVMMPLALPVAIFMESGPETASILAPGTVAAVFSGAVFGDHCSPLSDTTIVASIACDIEPLEHVRTQIPYALIAAGVALFIGFIPSGFGLPNWVSLIAGIAILYILAKIFSPSSSVSSA